MYSVEFFFAGMVGVYAIGKKVDFVITCFMEVYVQAGPVGAVVYFPIDEEEGLEGVCAGIEGV